MSKTKTRLKDDGRNFIVTQYNAFLDKWPAPFTEHEVVTSYGSTYVLEGGNSNKEILVLLHGSGENSTMWFKYWKQLSCQYHVFALDIPGEPGKSVLDCKVRNSLFYTEWLKAVLDDLHIQEACITGISSGANIALLMALYFPGRVKGVLALVPFGVICSISIRALIKILLLQFNYTRQKQAALFMYLNGGTLPHEEGLMVIDTAVQNRLKGNRSVTIPPWKNKKDLLKTVKVPCYCILGEHDPLYNSKAVKKEIDSLNCRIKVQIAKGMGHFLDFNLTPFLKHLGTLSCTKEK